MVWQDIYCVVSRISKNIAAGTTTLIEFYSMSVVSYQEISSHMLARLKALTGAVAEKGAARYRGQMA
jgi:hypothetical protein